MTEHAATLTAVDRELLRRRRRRWVVAPILAVLALVAFSLYRQVLKIDIPVDYANDEEHFKYGSIGSDTLGQGIPYWIWRAMPDVCPAHLPGGFAAIGIIQEPGKDTPVGFSKRRVGPLDQVGPNCGLCHTSSVRASAGDAPTIYTAAPAQQLNLMNYFRFLFTCGRDPNFTTENVMAAIDRHVDLSIFERLAYKLAIPQVRKALVEGGSKFDGIAANRAAWGPGRVDTFNPYKVLIFNLDMSNDRSIGTADFMSIWNQGVREGIWLHWDGNNDSVDERNLSAAMGAGATPIDYGLAAAGKPVYQRYCADCHEVGARYYGKVTPLKELGTDPERSKSFDHAMADRMNTIGEGYPWKFNRFRPTDGYANHPLDGIWLRAPYLHNGSVPTLRDLLKPANARPAMFYRGNDVYDARNVGFVSNVETADGRTFFKFDSGDRGNGNGGHLYGIELSEDDKNALIEYLKTL
jgi:mono/diheme cytochrome c family protein